MNCSLRIVVAVVTVLAGTARAVDVTYTVAARSDVRTRTPLPGDVGEVITGDLELAPRGEVLFGWSTDTLAAQYAPTLLWREPQTGGRLLPLHRGRLAWGHRWGRANLLLTQDGAYGVADIGALRPPDGSTPTVGEVQTVGGIPYVRSSTLLLLDARPTDTFSLDLGGGFSIQGSPERPDALPLQWGPTANARARFAVSRLDGLSTSASFLSARFATGDEQQVAQLRETWDRQLSRTLTLNLGAGVAFTRQLIVARLAPTATGPDPVLEPPPSGDGCSDVSPYECFGVLPVGLGSLGWRDTLNGTPLRLDGAVSLSPFADRFTGNVYERLEARASGEWQPAKGWSVRAGASGAYAVPIGLSQQAGDTLLSGDLLGGWNPQPWLLLQASARVLWTRQPRFAAVGQPVPGTTQAVVTLSVTVQQTDSTAW